MQWSGESWREAEMAGDLGSDSSELPCRLLVRESV
jgi:hypothetical protein